MITLLCDYVIINCFTNELRSTTFKMYKCIPTFAYDNKTTVKTFVLIGLLMLTRIRGSTKSCNFILSI